MKKLSVSIPHDLVLFIKHYCQVHAYKSKAHVVQKALKLLQQQELEQYYLEANAEIDPLYEIISADGLKHSQR